MLNRLMLLIYHASFGLKRTFTQKNSHCSQTYTQQRMSMCDETSTIWTSLCRVNWTLLWVVCVCAENRLCL